MPATRTTLPVPGRWSDDRGVPWRRRVKALLAFALIWSGALPMFGAGLFLIFANIPGPINWTGIIGLLAIFGIGGFGFGLVVGVSCILFGRLSKQAPLRTYQGFILGAIGGVALFGLASWEERAWDTPLPYNYLRIALTVAVFASVGALLFGGYLWLLGTGRAKSDQFIGSGVDATTQLSADPSSAGSEFEVPRMSGLEPTR